MKFNWILYFLVLVISTIGFSQEIDTNTVYVDTRTDKSLEDKLPGTIIYTCKDLEVLPAEKADDFLKYCPGINASRTEGIFSFEPHISMRGFEGKTSAYTLVMHNGIPVNLAGNHSVNWNRFFISNIEKIEVYKGPGAALYGNHALGGVINIIEKEAKKKIELEAGMTYGSFNKIMPEINIRGKLADKFSYSIAGYYLRSDGYRNTFDFISDSLSHIRNKLIERAISISINYKFQTWLNIKLHGSLFADERLDGLSSDLGKYYKKQNTPSYISQIYGSYNKFKYDFTAYYIWEDYERFYGYSKWHNNNFRWVDRIDTGFKLNASYELNENVSLNGGMDTEERSTLGKDKTIYLVDTLSHKGKYRFVSGYLQVNFSTFHNKLNFVAGCRYDNFSFYHASLTCDTATNSVYSAFLGEFDPIMWHNFSPRLVIFYKWTDKFRSALTYGRGFRAGTLEDYCRSEFYGHTVYPANPNLGPEITNTIELASVVEFGKKMSMSAGIYYTEGANFIYPQFVYYRYVDDFILAGELGNIRDFKLIGIDLDGRLKFNKKLNFNLNYNYNYRESIIPYSPDHICKAGLLFNDERISFAIMMIYKSNIPVNIYSYFGRSEYITGDTKIIYYTKNRKFALSFSIYDMFDNEQLEDNMLTPGIRFESKISYRF